MSKIKQETEKERKKKYSLCYHERLRFKVQFMVCCCIACMRKGEKNELSCFLPRSKTNSLKRDLLHD
jgi:hypothetical protein